MSRDLKQKIKDSIDNLVTLEIVTAVGQVKMKPKDGRDGAPFIPEIDYDSDPKVILTKIDILQGDIKTVYNEEFVTGNYQSLRPFHAAREKEGHDIVKKNIEAIKELLALANTTSDSEE